MRMLRICAAALALLLAVGTAEAARAACLPAGYNGTRALRQEASAAPALYGPIQAGQGRNWWGVLYGDALLLVRAEEGEELQAEEETDPVFIWPLWEWLLRVLGLT